MKRHFGMLAILAPLAFAPARAADPFDGISLSLANGAAHGEITLQWTGGDPTFTVYRSSNPQGIVNAVNELGQSDQRNWDDTPPAGVAFYYVVTSPCVYSGPEVCNGIDDDCDGVIPADEADLDGDGYRVCQGDCDDTRASVHPGAPEICDDLDNDCDGGIDNGTDAMLCPSPPPNSTQICRSGTCLEFCTANHSDCNGLSSDGCECATVGCCSTACQTTHSNGLGQAFYDCTLPGIPGNPSRYSQTLAVEAGQAWDSSVGFVGQCTYGVPLTPTNVWVVVSAAKNQCAVWLYLKNLAGHVWVTDGDINSCLCPADASAPTWY
jgi:hypothetical protein